MLQAQLEDMFLLSIIGFALISFLAKKRHNKAETNRSKVDASNYWVFLGAIPGCGATIVVASLYKNKKISFGGLFATFISTLGEGSFVLLGASNEADVLGNLKAYAIITIFGFVEVIFGYLSDIFGSKINFENKQERTKDIKSTKTKRSLAVIFVDKIRFLCYHNNDYIFSSRFYYGIMGWRY